MPCKKSTHTSQLPGKSLNVGSTGNIHGLMQSQEPPTSSGMCFYSHKCRKVNNEIIINKNTLFVQQKQKLANCQHLHHLRQLQALVNRWFRWGERRTKEESKLQLLQKEQGIFWALKFFHLSFWFFVNFFVFFPVFCRLAAPSETPPLPTRILEKTHQTSTPRTLMVLI